MSIKPLLILPCVVCFSAGFSLTNQAQSLNDDDYLKLIQQEAQSNTDELLSSDNPAQELTDIPGNLSQEVFEQTLSQHFPTDYVLFETLSSLEKQRVYQFYQVDSHIDAIRQHIIALLTNN